MKKLVLIVVVVGLAVAGVAFYSGWFGGKSASARPAAQGGPGGGGPGGFGGPGGGFGGPGAFGRPPLTVEVAQVKRADMATEVTVVGNLIGAATVEAVPKVAGRLESVNVRLGDRVARGQKLAKIEDQELQQQIKQQQAAYDVAAATIRQREAGLRQAQANLDRSRNLFERQLIPKQTYDDVEANYQAAVAQLDLANAQLAQTKARLDELHINLENTVIVSPVSGFIGKRALDPGAWVTTNSSFISVVDIGVVRLVANVVEKDTRRVTPGLVANVEVDAYPGETFTGRVAHVSPVLDPTTRTGQIEVEIANPQFRLKPGMYAKVSFKVDKRDKVLVIPLTALADVGGKRGVFQATKGKQGNVAQFKKVDVGLMDRELVEVIAGLTEGEQVVSTGAGALRDGDRILLPGQGGPQGRGPGGQNGVRRGGGAPGGMPGGGPGGPRTGRPNAGAAPRS
jgi:membrane fusion protein, multidrug efflux system